MSDLKKTHQISFDPQDFEHPFQSPITQKTIQELAEKGAQKELLQNLSKETQAKATNSRKWFEIYATIIQYLISCQSSTTDKNSKQNKDTTEPSDDVKSNKAISTDANTADTAEPPKDKDSNIDFFALSKRILDTNATNTTASSPSEKYCYSATIAPTSSKVKPAKPTFSFQITEQSLLSIIIALYRLAPYGLTDNNRYWLTNTFSYSGIYAPIPQNIRLLNDFKTFKNLIIITSDEVPPFDNEALRTNLNASPIVQKALVEYLLAITPPTLTDKCFFGVLLNYLHRRISKFMTADKNKLAASAFDNPQHFYQESAALELAFNRKYYTMISYEYNQATNIYQEFELEYEKESKPFVPLVSTLSLVFQNNISNLKKFSKLLARIYVGRKLLKDIEKNSPSNVTVIFCHQPKFLELFLLDIFHGAAPGYNKLITNGLEYMHGKDSKYRHISTYNIHQLSSNYHLSERIKNKILGNIVNIDATNQKPAPESKSTLTNLFKGKAIKTKTNDWDVTFVSNAHYIFIREESDRAILPYLPEDTHILTLDEDKQNHVYRNLPFYELFFMMTGFVDYGLHLLLTGEKVEDTPSKVPIGLSPEVFVDRYFIANDETLKSWFFLEDIYQYFKQISPETKLSANELRKIIDATYLEKKDNDEKAIIVYKDIDKRKRSGPNRETRSGCKKKGYIGILFKEEAFLKDLNTQKEKQAKQQKLIQEKKTSQDTFIKFMEGIINDYFPKY